MTARQYGAVGIVGVGVFMVAMAVLHILDPGLNVVDEYLSVYALGEFGWLSRVADFAMGAGVAAIALGLRKTLADSRKATTSWVLMLISGLGFVISGIFNTDPSSVAETTDAGALHDLGGYVSILSLMISTWLLRGVFRRDGQLVPMARIQAWFAFAMSAALVAFLASEPILGLTQRLFVLVVVAWLITLAANLRKINQPASKPPATATHA